MKKIPKMPVIDKEANLIGWVFWNGTWKRGTWEFIVFPKLKKVEKLKIENRFYNAMQLKNNVMGLFFEDVYGLYVRSFSGITGTYGSLRLLLPPFGLFIDDNNIIYPDLPKKTKEIT